MAKYRKKPVVIEAFKYGKDHIPDWFIDKVLTNDIITHIDHCTINTLEGIMRGDYGDYIIQGVQNEIYPCKPDIFEMTYESVGPTPKEIDDALEEHNLHQDWIEQEENLEALRNLLDKEMNDTRDEE
jgi:hypothetical protein